jgi:D-alanyl-D-alanine endopeptidase (penicillin-binding protein 7)
MKERVISAIIASLVVLVSLPGTSMAPTVLASSSHLPLVTSHVPVAPRAYIASLPTAKPAAKPQKKITADGRESLSVATTASHVYVVDQMSDSALYALRENEQVPLASITKLMTARVFRSKGVAWDKVVTMDAVAPDGGVAYFKNGDRVTVRDLWRTMLVGSSNTAALALAKATDMTSADFVAEMNANAAGLGMINTHFTEPTGLDEKNVSTAADISRLARADFNDPEVASAVALPYFDLVKIAGSPKRVVSTDKLLGSFIAHAPYKLLGGKTGFINESGYNIAISVTRAGASPITVVVLGAASNDLRFQEAKSVAYWTFENYIWPTRDLSAATR